MYGALWEWKRNVPVPLGEGQALLPGIQRLRKSYTLRPELERAESGQNLPMDYEGEKN